MFCLETDTLKMTLEIERVDALLLHENIIPVSANRLIMELSRLESLRNPIIVEQNNVVLDGNHRVYAFRELDFKFVPVCKIDYYNAAAKLKYWFRLFGNIQSIDIVKKAFQKAGATFCTLADKEALKKAMLENHLAFGFQYQNDYTLAEFETGMANDAVSTYNAIQIAQDVIIRKGATLQYIPCSSVDDIKFDPKLRSEEMVVWTPQITKTMVIEAAKKKKIFAPKTTRHLIPARPLNVDVPGPWLQENVSLDVINHRFIEFLEQKQIKRFGPGQVVDGRFYEEELYVFLNK